MRTSTSDKRYDKLKAYVIILSVDRSMSKTEKIKAIESYFISEGYNQLPKYMRVKRSGLNEVIEAYILKR